PRDAQQGRMILFSGTVITSGIARIKDKESNKTLNLDAALGPRCRCAVANSSIGLGEHCLAWSACAMDRASALHCILFGQVLGFALGQNLTVQEDVPSILWCDFDQ